MIVWASLSESRSSIIWWENVVRLTDWLTDCVCPSRVYITTHMTSYIQPHFQTSPVFYCLGFSFRIIITRKRKNGKKSNHVLYWTPVYMLGLLHRLTCQAVNRMPSSRVFSQASLVCWEVAWGSSARQLTVSVVCHWIASVYIACMVIYLANLSCLQKWHEWS